MDTRPAHECCSVHREGDTLEALQGRWHATQCGKNGTVTSYGLGEPVGERRCGTGSGCTQAGGPCRLPDISHEHTLYSSAETFLIYGGHISSPLTHFFAVFQCNAATEMDSIVPQ
jgi:hypothetical protein